MSQPKQSIVRFFMLHAGLPLTLVLVLVVGWLTSSAVTDYLEGRERVAEQVNRIVMRIQPPSEDWMSDMEIIRSERMQTLNRKLVQDLSLAAGILLIGIGVPLLASRHVAHLVRKNLDLLEDRLASSGREGSALMPQTFDLEEFDEIIETMRRSVRIRHETEQRWKRAEEELVAANHDLMRRAEELKQGRKVALSMMEDAELAREQLEKVNERLNQVIQHAEQSAREADLANRAKSDFLATMSHEIRTPLNGVIGFIEMLSDTDLNEEQREYADTVRSSGEALMALINDVLDFSKIESGHLHLEAREFHLIPMLRELSSLFFNDAARKGLGFRVDIGDSVPRLVTGDETRVRQIITNLLANAIKFTESGEVRLSVERYAGPDVDGNCELEFEVRDSGIGMNKDQIQRLFLPFSQGDSSTTRKYGGTGLGLAICKRLAEAMGGRVWATSKEGRGSSFFVRIKMKSIVAAPEATVTPESNSAVASEADQSRKPGEEFPLRIAVAEDNLANQRVLSIMLKRLGWDAVCQENGETLVEYLKENTVDIVFMDLQMPVMDGIEATTLIRSGEAGEPNRNAKIIALTANALQGDADRCLRIGMDAYISKPIKLEVLKTTIMGLIEQEA